jgi:DNA-directed RNA polymerase II subunit RPB1
MVEAKDLMAVDKHVLNAQTCKPLLSIVQDSLIGAYLLTHLEVFLERHEVMQLIMQLKYREDGFDIPIPAILKPKPLWTGKQVFSLCLPSITIHRNTKNMDDATIIAAGELLVGQMTKNMLGTASGGIIHVACKVVGNTRCVQFMSDCQRLVNTWLEGYGFSIGIGDCIVSEDMRMKVQGVVKNYVKHVDTVEIRGRALNIPFDKREATASKLLSRMLDVTGGMVQKDMKPMTNSLLAMVKAGSKGNPINISQILGCVGQQSIGGRRVFDKHNPEDRNFSCFSKGDQSAEGKGFVKNSYSTGLTAPEMFFHTMSGREGIVDTSVKTGTILRFFVHTYTHAYYL